MNSLSNNNQKENTFFENLKFFNNLIDNLRETGLENYLDIPRICVLGLQSSGKSSLLETIVGLDFFTKRTSIE